MRTLLCVWLVLGALSPALAEDRPAARAAFVEGTKFYDLNQFSDALAAFKRAYWNFQDPAILFNIAQCYRQREPEMARPHPARVGSKRSIRQAWALIAATQQLTSR